MEKGQNLPVKYRVKFNNTVIFTHSDKSIAVEFAIMLFRSSNEPHNIVLCSEGEPDLLLFSRK